MIAPIDKFQTLLRELFQFDCADLDFGIYRIMNQKRDVIEKFITEDLPKAISEELDRGALADQTQAAKELKEVASQIRETLGEYVIDTEGNLAETYYETPLGKKYLGLKGKAASGYDREALNAIIFNHLYTFFSRYYQDGDFISKRRYSKRQKYAIPYNGEEVYLYWANHDQYYIKTAEHFHDYTFSSRGVTVHFKLVQADVEQNNVKGDKRFFLPRLKEIDWDEEAGQLVIPFEYRPLTEQEAIKYGKSKQQDKIIEETLEGIPKRLKKADKALMALTTERHKTADGKRVSYLAHHLRQYTRRNTSDFFIHKDLKGFLTRELDFYLKNEVLNLDEIEAAVENRAERWFQLMRVIKAIGSRIIEFLAQIEDFQKMLWEKRKFVTETQYCITVGNINERFYPEIAACDAQWDEWKELGFIGNAAVPAAGVGEPSAANGNAAVPAASEAKLDLFTTLSSDTKEKADSAHKGWHSRGYLPHLDVGEVIQFISFRLYDSVPANIIERWKDEIKWTEKTTPDSEKSVTLRKKIEEYEDSGVGSCYLRDERIAAILQETLKRFDGERYHLIAWCIMPNHVHVLVKTKTGYSLSDVVHSWKSYTAHRANELLGRKGRFWMPEYFDRFIRNEKHFAAVLDYIRQNPVKAGLVDDPEKWPWSGHVAAGSADVAGNASGSLAGGCRPEACDPRIDFLKAHPTLVLDTKHFDQDFVDRLLASFDDLDELTDGLLVHSENWQALNLLMEKYRERVKCIYIDPPFNSPSTEILYKNDYKHSTWLSLLSNRISKTSSLLSDGVYVIAIDENEQERLGLMIESTWLRSYKKTCVAIRHNPRGIQGTNFSYCHEYAYFLYPSDEKKYIGERFLEDPDVRNLRDSGTESDRSDARNCFYPFIVRNGSIVAVGEVPADDFHPAGANEVKPDGTILIWPIDTSGREKKWRYARQSVEAILPKLEVRETKGTYQIYYAKDTGTVRTLWTDAQFDASEYGTKLLQEIFGTRDLDFSYPKSLYTLIETIQIASKKNTWILDYFAGSGTTAHAVINLNREDGGRRRFILVEMGDYFDTVLLPRIKKVTFTPEWKDGKPKRMATQEEAERSPRVVQYIRLESYEDTLNNIEFDEASGQRALKYNDYLLKYMLKWETKRSETLLNVEKLACPFSYKLHIHADGRTREKVVDIPETFNYLLGLHVKTRKVYYAGNAAAPAANGECGRDARDPMRRYLVYRGTVDHKEVVVIWRETEGWEKEDFERDKEFAAEQNLTEGADEVFVNGDSFIKGAKALEPVFKARLFASVEV